MSKTNRDPVVGFGCDADGETLKGNCFSVRVAPCRIGYDHRPYVDYANAAHLTSPEALAEWARALFTPKPEPEE